MDVRNWPIDRVMQLPDECFGARWLAATRTYDVTGATQYFLSEDALPERCVIWGLWMQLYRQDPTDSTIVGFRLGDSLPANAAEFLSLERLFRGWGHNSFPTDFRFTGSVTIFFERIRIPLAAGGRRIVLMTTRAPETAMMLHTGVVISSFPREIPDHLLEPKTNKIISLLESIKKWSVR